MFLISTFRHCGRAMLVASLVSLGCSSKLPGEPRLKTTPVTGIVYVDGEPAIALTVECHPESSDCPIKHPVIASTDAKGKFDLGMYVAGDGLPEGTYRLVFIWQGIGLNQRDRLKGYYANPSKSKTKITVIAGNHEDLGVINLSTKGPS
ncbi:hypothetical protein [Schlesneria paludicola]|uniref:hypothetical protein n=1 Tax=Schlesneria paludicola TaxID=360056 RepID=UPI0012F99FC8|nr:hypothetical protein [Schlesneria paludicola]